MMHLASRRFTIFGDIYFTLESSTNLEAVFGVLFVIIEYNFLEILENSSSLGINYIHTV